MTVTLTLAYGDDPTATAVVGSVPLPDDGPSVSSVLAVVLIPIFLVIFVTYPWWKRRLPPFVLCGCCPFIVVHSEHEDAIPDIVDLAFARLEAAGAGPKEVSMLRLVYFAFGTLTGRGRCFSGCSPGGVNNFTRRREFCDLSCLFLFTRRRITYTLEVLRLFTVSPAQNHSCGVCRVFKGYRRAF
jgi:hypothetical protein